jgi:SCP-2 sterol transfer family
MARTKQPTTEMSNDPVDRFLWDLASRGHEPLLHGATGTLRIELTGDTEPAIWWVTIDRGDVAVSRRGSKPDASFRTERWLFEGMLAGSVNATAAMLRGVLTLEGDLGLITAFSRLLPGPPRSLASFRKRQMERVR